MFDFVLEKTLSEQVYFYIAVFGTTISVILALLMFVGILEEIGFDFNLDFDTEYESDFFNSSLTPFKLFTFKGFVAGITFLGWSGYATNNIFIALITGFVTYLLIGFLYLSTSKFQQSGNYYLTDTVGKEGTVYLRIKGDKGSVGKVHIKVANGLKEFLAISDQDLEYGQKIKVDALIDEKLFVRKVEG